LLKERFVYNNLNLKEVVSQVRDLLKLNNELTFDKPKDQQIWDQLVLFTAFSSLIKLDGWEQWAVDAIARRYDVFPIMYRFDASGNMVPLSNKQKDKIANATKPTLYIMNSYVTDWADHMEQTVILIPSVSRELTQVRRRISQHPGRRKDGTYWEPFALIYFGVNDDGTLYKGTFEHVRAFANATYAEFLDEGLTVQVAGYSAETFQKKQQSFKTFAESEEGYIEYKSTGGHKSTWINSLPQFKSNVRVIEFLVKAPGDTINPKPPIQRKTKTVDPYFYEASYTMQKITLYEDSPICRVSRTRQACWTKPGFFSLPRQTQIDQRQADNQLIKSAKSFGRLLEAINTAITVCRQHPKVQRTEPVKPQRAPGKRKQPSLRQFDLSKPDDRVLFDEITKINEFLIRYYNDFGIDKTIDLVKENAAEIRVMWQIGDARVESRANPLTKLVAPCLSHIYTVHTYNDATGVVLDDIRYHIASYACCVYGFLGRALPRPTDEKVERARWETYERFGAKQIVDAETRQEITEWAMEFFKEMKSPDDMPLETPSIAGCLERQRSKGGVANYLSQMYKECKKKTPEELEANGLKQTSRWRKGFVDRILEPGDILHFQNEGSVFAWCFAYDVLEEYVEHAPKCIRHLGCTQPEKHLPMMPFGIAELGGKCRIPCITSGLLNILASPIREAMFRIIRSDPRCKYRTKGAGDKQLPLISKFLDSLSKNDITHSGDMTVSTDAFPLQFMESVINGLPIPQRWKNIALLATGPFIMVAPSEQNEEILKHNRVMNQPELETTVVDHRPAFLGKMLLPKWFNQEYNKKPEVNVEECVYNGVRFIGTRKVSYPAHTQKPGEIITVKSNKEQAGLGFEPLITFEQPDDTYWGNSYLMSNVKIEKKPEIDILANARRILKVKWDTSYVTTSGLQMATACSITMLYSFNLFCDSYAKALPGAIGKSLLCGDDSLRSGNEIYIEGYKFKARSLYAIFSAWKDVTAMNARGLFTEQYMEEEEVLKIPKLKTIIRPKGPDGAIPWKKAIQAIKTLRTCDDAGLVHLQEEMLYKYRNVLAEHEGLLPFGTEPCVGGLGSLFEPLTGRNKSIWERIKSHPHVYTRYQLSRMFMRSLTPYTLQPSQKLPHIDAFSMAKPVRDGERLYIRGAARWLSDQEQYLRGLLSAAAVMVEPPRPVIFAKEKTKNSLRGLPERSGLVPFSVRKHFETLDQIEQMLTEDGACGPRTGVSSPTDLVFYNTTHHADYPSSIVGAILGPSMAAKPTDF